MLTVLPVRLGKYRSQHPGSAQSREATVEASKVPLSSKKGPAASRPAFNLLTKGGLGVTKGGCARGLSGWGCLKVARTAACSSVTTKKLREDTRHPRIVGAVAAVACHLLS